MDQLTVSGSDVFRGGGTGEAFFPPAAGIAVIDRDLRYVRINHTLAEANGLSADEHIGRTVAEVIPQLAPTLVPILQQVLATGMALPHHECSGETARAPGVTRSWVLSFYPVRGSEGTVAAVEVRVVETTPARPAPAQRNEWEWRFHDMLVEAELIALTLDRSARVTYCNDFLLTLTGRPREEVIGADWFDTFLPPDCPDVRHLFRMMLAAGRATRYENPIRTRDGQMRRILWNNTLLRDAEGHVLGVACLGEDVTERWRATEALRETELRFRQLAESIREVFWMTDLAKRSMLYVSPAYERIWGRSVASVLADPMSWLEAVHPDDRDRVRAAVKHQATTGYDEEYRILQPGGAVRWIRDRSFPIRDEAGAIYRIGGVAEDITERRWSEESRAQSEERFSAIFRHSPVAICYKTREGRIIDANEKFAALVGYRPTEMVGRTTGELGLWVSPEEHETVRATLLRGGRVENREVQFRRKDGQVRTTLLSMETIQLRDRPVLLATLIDVTEQKAVEQTLRRVERLECVGQLASGIAHDMNNILTPIMMAAPLLRLPISAPEREKTLATIEVSAKRGADLARQLLSFSRGSDAERVHVDLGGIVKEVAKIAGETFPKSIAIATRVPAGLWPVYGNAAQLHQVVLNLCVNARDAMPDGGQLTIVGANFTSDAAHSAMNPALAPGAYIKLSVSDTGSGIPPELVDRIFEPFFTTKAPGQGTGLGLSTVAGVVKGHGGTVTVRSEPRHGSTFEILLPAAPGGGPEPVAEPAPVPQGNGELVLVVDDEEAIRTVLQHALQRHGYTVLVATDGADALVAFSRSERPVSVVVTDLDMPLIDGVGLVRALRRVNPAVRVVVSTGTTGERGPVNTPAALAALGVAAVLRKPYGADQLLRALHDTLRA